MRFPPDVQAAAAALRTTLDADRPRGSAVRARVRAFAGAAWRAGVPAASLVPLLGATVLPLLRARHPGPAGDWLWERLVAWAREDHAAAADFGAAVPAAGAPPDAHPPDAHPPDARPAVYRLDARDVITRVNAAWRAFATENGAPALAARAVGTSLWAHVDGAETRRLYRAVHAAVRRSGRPVTLPFRCDAPAEQRWMTLTVRPLGGGHLQVVSALVRRAAQPRVPLLDPAAPRGAGQLVMCSWCKRVHPDGGDADGDADAGWVDAAAVRPHGVPDGAGAPWRAPRLVHDVCPGCAADVRAALASA